MAFRGPARLLPPLVRAVDPVAEEGVGAVVLGRDSNQYKLSQITIIRLNFLSKNFIKKNRRPEEIHTLNIYLSEYVNNKRIL